MVDVNGSCAPSDHRGPRYSILYNACNLSEEADDIDRFLAYGIKVLWFGSESDATTLGQRYPLHIKCRLLNIFTTNCNERFSIVDGRISGLEAPFEKISENRRFNSEQYLVEHSSAENLMVEAGAGTGKTTVMVDRIMFLLATVDGLTPADIGMITFTNDATDQMNSRLQDTLMERFEATGNDRFLKLLELQSQMNISTIHSFAFKLLRQYGIRWGLTRDVSIESFRYDVDQIIDGLLNKTIHDGERVRDQLGMPAYEVRKLIHSYWDRFLQLGIPDEDIESMDWGHAGGASENLQATMSKIMPAIANEYAIRKYKRDAVSLADMIRDLERMIPDADQGEDVGLRFLFVDEFQDSDDAQINLIVKLCRAFDVYLFAVGDVKQSIYRFRGADDSAFETLICRLADAGRDVARYSLVNNYRTSPDILERLTPVFESWSKSDMLRFDADVYAHRTDIDGECNFTIFSAYDSLGDMLADELNAALADLAARLEGGAARSSDKVVVLTRTNFESIRVAKLCRGHGIPAIVKQTGGFFASEAVRDFHSLLSSFVYPDAVHIFNYISSPYCPLDRLPDIDDLVHMDGDERKTLGFLEDFVAETGWAEYRDLLDVRPTMSVLNDIVTREPVLERYASRLKADCESDGWDETRIDGYVYTKTRQYEADLDKLMEILQHNTKGKGTSLFDLHRYLDLMMRTNRDEESVDIDDGSNSVCVHCMTVHKAKGLEFDTVVIPYTNHTFRMASDSEVLWDRRTGRVGWTHTDEDRRRLGNDNYKSLRSDENIAAKQEETRLLYVAMTRAIRRLSVFVNQSYRKNTWSELLFMGGAV